MKVWQSITGYFRGVAAEARKVTWPTFPTLVRYFLSVVVGVALATGFIAGVDYLFIKLLSLIIK